MSKKVFPNVNLAKADLTVGQRYILQLFVTGVSPNSMRAIINIKLICEKYLQGRYELEIIDIYQQPSIALKEEIIAVPILIKKFPLPEVRMIGDLSDIDMVLEGLHLI
ncbi:MAG: circadian clock KaiB family protein [Ferruginibacter sp.]